MIAYFSFDWFMIKMHTVVASNLKWLWKIKVQSEEYANVILCDFSISVPEHLKT